MQSTIWDNLGYFSSKKQSSEIELIAAIFETYVCSLDWHLPKYTMHHVRNKAEMRKYMLKNL